METSTSKSGAMGAAVRVEIVTPSRGGSCSISTEELQNAVNRLQEQGFAVSQITPYATHKNSRGDFQETADAFLITAMKRD